jgi:hypothetical protein
MKLKPLHIERENPIHLGAKLVLEAEEFTPTHPAGTLKGTEVS